MADYDSPHRSNLSLGLQAPTGILPPSQNLKQQRRMTSPAMSSASSLSLPDGGRQPYPRPPSPLRNGFTFDSSTGIDPNDHSDGSDNEDDEDREHGKWQRSPSPSSSVSHLAASFVQRMNNYVGSIVPKSPGALPSDAELEAEAERERERSRREAEAILTREAQQRKLVEDRVLAMMDNTKSLPPPPSGTYTQSNPPSPSGSQKESTGWWRAAKNKLTPTKDKGSPTPAQQIILEAQARQKDTKGTKEIDSSKQPDPTRVPTNLNIPVQPPQRKPVPVSPSSPTPSRPNSTAPNLTPSPLRAADSISNSPSREAPPMYAQFTPQGTLDMAGTLIAIAKRFEKLEKWTVGHVRALEDRMNDVERWLVDKEKGKDEEKTPAKTPPSAPGVHAEMTEIRDEISELQGRVGELGREMAKLATAPGNLSSGPKSQTAAVTVAPRQASATLVHEIAETFNPSEVMATPRHPRLPSTTARDSTSPPLASHRTSSGNKLPYPTGDYTSPPDVFSPPNSPPASVNSAFRNKMPISGLPSSSTPSPISSGINLASERPISPPAELALTRSTLAAAARALSPTPAGKSNSSRNLPPPKSTTSHRQTSVSPTPRKRYTVALGGPIVAPPELQSNSVEPPSRRVGTPKSYAKALPVDTDDDDDDEGEEEGDGGETIGKSAAVRLTRALATKRSTTSLNSLNSLNSDKDKDEPTYRGGGDYKAPSSPSPLSKRRMRAQSAYVYSSIQAQDLNALANINTTAPLRLKTRTRSTEQLNAGGDGDSGVMTAVGGKFVDPLLLRRQEAANNSRPIAMPKPVGKVPIGQLVAFFDGDKKDKT